MLTRRQFFVSSLATAALASSAEWLMNPILVASDDKDTLNSIHYSDSGEGTGPR